MVQFLQWVIKWKWLFKWEMLYCCRLGGKKCIVNSSFSIYQIYNQKAYKTWSEYRLLNALTTMSCWFIETDFFTSVHHLHVHILFLFPEAKARHQCLSTPWWQTVNRNVQDQERVWWPGVVHGKLREALFWIWFSWARDDDVAMFTPTALWLA